MPRGRPRKIRPEIQSDKVVLNGKHLCPKCKESEVNNFPDYLMKMMPEKLICNACATNVRKTVD